MNCDPKTLAMSAKCYCFPRKTAQATWIYLLCRLANSSLNPFPDTVAGNWARRVVANGGARPNESTTAILGTFYDALVSAGIDGKMIAVVCFVPDSLIAALTPLIAHFGNDPWINHGFVGPGTDLSINGLQGDGVGKYLDTGVFPLSLIPANTAIPTDTSAGFTVYNVVGLDQDGTDMGCQQFGGLPIAQCAVSYASGSCFFDCWNTTVGQGRLTVNNTGFAGYFSCNRTAAAQFRIYRASNGIGGHQLLANGATASPQGRPVSALYCFAHADQHPDNSNFPVAFSAHTLSFAAVHLGLTQTESIAFWTAIQAMRTSLGGGAV